MIALFRPKSKIEERENFLVISIPTPKVWFTMIFLPVWLTGWAFGLVTVLRALFDITLEFNRIFTIAWLTFWIIGGSSAIFVLVRMYFGREIVTMTTSEFQIKNDTFGFRNTQMYDRKFVSEFRFSPDTTPLVSLFTLRGNLGLYGFVPGSIAFDYGARTVRFAAGLDETEARALVEKIKERFPEVLSNVKDNSRFVPR